MFQMSMDLTNMDITLYDLVKINVGTTTDYKD